MQNELTHQDYLIALSLAKQILDGIVFKQNVSFKLDIDTIEALSHGVYIQTGDALTTLALLRPRLIDNLTRKVAPKSAAFISTIAYELLEQGSDISYLVDAGTVMCLIQIIDHLMDRGDEVMLQALEIYFKNEMATTIELRARMQPVDHCVMLSERVAMQDTNLMIQASLDVLRDEAAILRSSNEYKELNKRYWKDMYFRRNAETLADISIRNGGLRPATYLVYLSYLHAGYDAPPISHIIACPDIMRLVRLGEWAIRLWDDWGDRELDAGKDIYTNAFAINVFLERNPYLTEAYLRDIAGTPYYQRAWNIIQEGNEGINYIIIGILREEFTKLKATIHKDCHLFLQILERIIEAGFINVAGDEAISAVKEVVSDYGKAH